MAKYTIGKVEIVTAQSGKEYKKVNVKDESGKITEKASAWPDYADYSKLVTGGLVEGVLTTKGQYTNLTNGNLGAKPAAFGGGAKAMETKAANIKVAQERKEGAIEISATARDATLIVTTFYKDLKPEEIKKQWIYWRRWLLNNWDNTTNTDLTSHGDPVPNFERPSEDINPEDIPF